MGILGRIRGGGYFGGCACLAVDDTFLSRSLRGYAGQRFQTGDTLGRHDWADDLGGAPCCRHGPAAYAHASGATRHGGFGPTADAVDPSAREDRRGVAGRIESATGY